MALCAHADEKTSIVRSNMTSTVYRLDCRDCGRSVYYTEVTVPDIAGEEDSIQSFSWTPVDHKVPISGEEK